MQLEIDLKERVFDELNRYTLDMQRLVGASAASVLVIRDGLIVNEWYSGTHDFAEGSRAVDAQSQFNIASIRKTYLGFAISLALHEGRLKSVNDRIIDYLGDLDERVMAGTTIRHLLTHTHGLHSQWKRNFPVGTDWQYNNVGVNLLIRLVQALFGQPLAKVIEDRVLLPYGFAETGWRKANGDKLVWMNESYAGEQGGEANLFVSTRELGLWGYLHQTKGVYQGKQHVPAVVFEQAVSIMTPSLLDELLPRNGFFWWVQDRPRPVSELGDMVPRGSYQSFGAYGNAVLVIPEYNAVAVRMLNQTVRRPDGYDYLSDIRSYGNIVTDSVVKCRL